MEQKNDLITFPYVIHESDMAREERKQKRLWILIILELLVAAFAILKPSR